MRIALRLLIVACLAVSACGGTDDDRSAPLAPEAGAGDRAGFAETTGAVIANSPGTITTAGPQRVLAAILGPTDRPFLGGSDLPLSVTFEPTDGGPGIETGATWLSTNGTQLGLYVSSVEFPTAGPWDVILATDDGEVARTQVQVTDESPVPRIGDQAPTTDTPTGVDRAEIDAISTDPEPTPAFYALSIAEAVDNGRPTMIAFVTPGLCQSALCGPTLEAVKGAAAGRAELDVVHVEPFDLELATTGELRPVPAMAAWGLQTEPWVFVVDASGAVQASFEGLIGQSELETALDQLDGSP